MKTKINNAKELHAEIRRLRAVADVQEEQLQSDLQRIRNDFRAENILLNALSSVTGLQVKKEALLKSGLVQGITLLVQRMVLKAEKKVEDKLYAIVDELVERVRKFLNKAVSSEARRDERKESVTED
jgi:hypothetical protein